MTVEQEALLRKAHDSLRAAGLLAAEGLVDLGYWWGSSKGAMVLP